MKTLSTIKAVPNKSKRTYTLYVQQEGKTYTKYRTDRLTREKFDRMSMYTDNDWKNFLNRTEEYKKIK